MSQMSIHNRTKLEVEANWQFRGSKFANFYDNYNYPPEKVSLTTLKSNVRGEVGTICDTQQNKSREIYISS